MKIQITNKRCSDLSADLAVVGAYADGSLTRAARELDRVLGGHLARAAREEMKGALGDGAVVHTLGQIRPRRVLVVGLGKKEALDANAARAAAITAGRIARSTKSARIACALLDEFAPGARPLAARACAEGAVLGSYAFTKYLTDGRKPSAADTLTIVASGDARAITREANVRGVSFFAPTEETGNR